MISINEALQIIDRSVQAQGTERIPLSRASGRRLATALIADVDSPPHDKSIMDGYALRSEDLAKGLRRFSISETIVAGSVPQKPVGPGESARVMTGAPLPPGADVVVMRERVVASNRVGDKEWVELAVDPLESGHHVLRQGASMKRGELIFDSGRVLRSADLGLAAEIGAAEIEVFRRPNVAVLATGSELVPCGQFPSWGQIRNSNGPLLMGLAAPRAESIVDLGIVEDQYDRLLERCRAGLECDLLILSGGVSEGIADLVPRALNDLNVQCHFHKVSIKPGKPIWFGVRPDDRGTRVVFGLPGNPLSTLICFLVFVRPCMEKWSGGRVDMPCMTPARLSMPHRVRGERPTFWPVRSQIDAEGVRHVAPLDWHGSSDLRCLADADGFIFCQPNKDQYPAGALVSYLSLD